MKGVMRSLFGLIITLMIIVPACSCAENKTHILYIDSYDPGMKFSQDELAGFQEVIYQSYPDAIIRIEYMDTKYISDDVHIRNLFDKYEYKYRNTTFDIVVAADDSAFSFVKKYRSILFPETPVIFLGVNYYTENLTEGLQEITGVIQDYDTKNTIISALSLFPDTRSIYIIHDQSYTGIATRKQTETTMPSLDESISVHYLTDLTLEELIETIETIPDGSIILLQVFNRDKDGVMITHEEFSDIVTSHARVPVFGTSELMLNHGIIGGKITEGVSHGKKAGELAVRVIHGESADSIPILRASPNQYIFDNNLLQKYQIPDIVIPEGSQIINKPTPQEVPVWILYITLTIIILCTIIIIILLYHLRIRERTEKDLRKNISERLIAEEKLKRDESRLESLLNIHQYQGHTIQDIWKNALHESIKITGSKAGFIFEHNPDGRAVCCLAYADESKDAHSPKSIEISQATLDWFTDLQPYTRIIVEDIHNEINNHPELSDIVSTRLCSISLTTEQSGKKVIVVIDKSDPYDEQDTRQLTLLMDSVLRIVEKKQAMIALREKSEFLSSLITHANTPIIVWNPEFLITEFNCAIEALSGYTRDSKIHTDIRSFLQFEPGDEKEGNFYSVKKTVNINSSISTATGEIKHIIWNTAPIQDIDGKVLVTIAMGLDITEVKKLEKERSSLILQIERNIAELSILNDGIRNPLTIISTMVEMCDCEYHEKINAEIIRIDNIVTELDQRWVESEKILAYLQRHHGLLFPRTKK